MSTTRLVQANTEKLYQELSASLPRLKDAKNVLSADASVLDYPHVYERLSIPTILKDMSVGRNELATIYRTFHQGKWPSFHTGMDPRVVSKEENNAPAWIVANIYRLRQMLETSPQSEVKDHPQDVKDLEHFFERVALNFASIKRQLPCQEHVRNVSIPPCHYCSPVMRRLCFLTG